MQGAPALDGLQIPLDADDALADQAAIGFDLGLAGAAEKAEAAALPLKMGPRANEAGALIFQVGELHLQRALGGAGPLAENLEDQPGAVDDLAAEGLLEIALLRRGQSAVHDHEVDLLGLHLGGDRFDLALADKGRRPDRVQRNAFGAHDREIDGARQGRPPLRAAPRDCATRHSILA